MKSRWLWYTLIGIAFGVFDFYYHDFISNILYPQATLGRQVAWYILGVGIWLVPIIPIILHEAKVSRSAWLSALASTLTWCAAVAAYYLTNGFQLAFVGVPARPELHISNRGEPYFWANWRSQFFGDLVGGSIEWLIVAVVGGMFIGFVAGFMYLRLKKLEE